MVTKSKPKATQSDNTAAYILLAIVVIAIAGFMGWMYFQYKERAAAGIAYTSFGPIVVRGSEFSVRTSVSVQSRSGNASAMNEQGKQIEFALQSAFSQLDPRRAKQPDGVAYVQQVARDSVKSAIGPSVEDVLITDFIIQEN
ncbi:MAG: flagellar basal body-associated FliL family protein [Oxalicibacterium faecigallinarum]|uniref:Flagellar protein FliL n=1 Tax=Oxalicibacterium faecigallinarum TaxID=573741 RepID=A0A8J3AT63_9BURK|nr:flagellar basal body-associated FliL family protein [Oxalicibacterium faecigallinarum]MDQ7969848.1 flagellar basal body-associated FliL family protein [Oxalicibacterium faecigallinarum]GGI18120.1 hypothetical protein GCM10008066_12410 [Oxalicibacterium faecigallinarum]